MNGAVNRPSGMNAPNLRACAAVALLSVSLACFVFAMPKSPAQIAKIRSDCADDAVYWRTNCINNIPANSTNRQADVDQCNQGAEGIDLECLRRGGVLDAIANGGDAGGTPLPKKGAPNPTPTPRPGPGGISGLPESNPTATPRKGKDPGGVSSLPKSHPSPTPSPSGPTLLNKHAKSTPTPTPNHYHGHSPSPTPNPNRSKGHQ